MSVYFLKNYLSSHELDHLAHRHSRRETVGVHDEVGTDAGVGEGHVLLGDDDSADTLLPVPRGKLVAHLTRAKTEHTVVDNKQDELNEAKSAQKEKSQETGRQQQFRRELVKRKKGNHTNKQAWSLRRCV